MLFILKFYDTDIQEASEMEFASVNHALETYETLKDQNGIENIHILQYEKGEYTFVM